METKRKLRELLEGAEERALIHFRKLQAIESILDKGEATKEPTVITVDKIKEVIRRQNEITSRHVKINSYIYFSTNMYEMSRRKYGIRR